MTIREMSSRMADETTSEAPTYRQRQAAETRARIAQAARQVFADRGYGAANITDVAQAAGVAVPTVYKLYGNKRALLAAIADAWGQEFGARSLDVPRGPAAAISWWSGMARRQWEAGLDIGLIYAGAVTSEPDVRADLEPRLAMREQAIRLVSEAILPRLKDGLTQDDAIAIISALTIPEVYRDLVRDRGWTPDRYQQWVEHALTEQLLTRRTRTRPNLTP
jgi:AcrR family transcriptional regulator